MSKEHSIYCKYCNKKLIERGEDGTYHFVFGAPRDEEGTIVGEPPVDLLILGNIQMVCIRRTCRKVNILNFLPSPNDQKN
jgi:hypothetical protein